MNSTLLQDQDLAARFRNPKLRMRLNPLNTQRQPYLFLARNRHTVSITSIRRSQELLHPTHIFSLRRISRRLLLRLSTMINMRIHPILSPVRLRPLIQKNQSRMTLSVTTGIRTLPAPITNTRGQGNSLIRITQTVTIMLIVRQVNRSILTRQ